MSVLKHIQRRASNSLSKCSNVSISYFPLNLSKHSRSVQDLDTTWWNDRNVLMSDSVIFRKLHQFFFARARKTALTFLKNKIFTSGQKHLQRIGNAFPKHPKTSKTDQNSKSYPKKTEGWASNSWTQFSY